MRREISSTSSSSPTVCSPFSPEVEIFFSDGISLLPLFGPHCYGLHRALHFTATTQTAAAAAAAALSKCLGETLE